MQQAPVRKLHPLATGATIFGAVFLVLLSMGRFAPGALAQATAAAPAPIASSPVAVTKPAVTSTKPASNNSVHSASRSAWNELTPPQQQALKPLAANWGSMSQAQKRKWLAISKNFPAMAPVEQAKLHSRMADWVSLSTQQRTQARLNFAETKQLSADEKKAKWQAYQALSAEEKQKLAAKAPPKLTGAAPAVKPAPHQKLTAIRAAKPNPTKPIAGQHRVDRNTLLPQSPQAALVPTPAQNH